MFDLSKLFSSIKSIGVPSDPNATPDGGFEGVSDEDFLFGDLATLKGSLESLPKSTYPQSLVSWNQGKHRWSRMFCTAVAPMTSIQTIYNSPEDDGRRKDFFSYAKEKYGYREGKGNYMNVGVDCSRNYHNANTVKDEVLSFRTTWNSPDFRLALKKHYGVVVGYNGNRAYNVDKLDGILDESMFGPREYGHILRMYAHDLQYTMIRDNYPGRIVNDYMVRRENIQALRDNNVFYNSAYVLIPKKVIAPGLPLDIIKFIMQDLTRNSNMWNEVQARTDISQKDKQEFQNILHEQNKRMREQYGKYINQ